MIVREQFEVTKSLKYKHFAYWTGCIHCGGTPESGYVFCHKCLEIYYSMSKDTKDIMDSIEEPDDSFEDFSKRFIIKKLS